MAVTTHEIEKRKESTPTEAAHTNGRTIIPEVDIIEKSDHYLLIADLPGVDEKELDISIEKDLLTITGKMLIQIPENHRPIRSEFRSGRYHRAFRIYEDIDRDNIKANFKNGVLTLTIPKAENAKVRKIEIQSE
ncbi:MAG: Hsp20/alpha crystallin family protein [Nitrospirae bacterium]|nr:MAG: Hsp20/alpha crystallin family protein [Nitrospirota bacterium]